MNQTAAISMEPCASVVVVILLLHLPFPWSYYESRRPDSCPSHASVLFPFHSDVTSFLLFHLEPFLWCNTTHYDNQAIVCHQRGTRQQPIDSPWRLQPQPIAPPLISLSQNVKTFGNNFVVVGTIRRKDSQQ